MIFYRRFPSSCPTKNTCVISAICFHYINKYLIVTLSEQRLVPGSKVPLPLVKCCICCPLKLHAENRISPVSESRADPPHTSTEEAGTCSWRRGTLRHNKPLMKDGAWLQPWNHSSGQQGLRNWRLSCAQTNQQKSLWLFSAWRHWLAQEMRDEHIVTETGKKLEWQVVRLTHTVEEGKPHP